MTNTALKPVSSFDLDPIHKEFRSVCRAFVREQVLPLVDESEKTKTFPKQLWSKLGECWALVFQKSMAVLANLIRLP
jgi:Acyl-CoA dehydrogenase, N-terminal domain